MKTGKRFLSIFLAVLMLLTAAPLAGFVGLEIAPKAQASDTLAPTGQCGDNVYWNFDEATGALTISGTGAIRGYFFSEKSEIKSLTIQDGVTHIGYYAFSNCDSLTSVTIPDSVTSIGLSAFDGTRFYSTGANWLNDVLYIGNHLICARASLSDNYSIREGTKTIADSAFSNCDSLTSVTIPDSVTSIGLSAFDGTRLYSTEGNWLNDVLYIGNHLIYARRSLSGNYSIRERTKTVADGAFSNCNSLTSIVIPKSLTSIGKEAFAGCTNLTAYVVDAESSTFSTDAFGCLYNKAKTVLIQYPIGNKSENFVIPTSVTRVGDYAFYECRENLKSITIPDGVTNIGDSAFSFCTDLTSIEIPPSVTSIGENAFSYCYDVKSLEIPDGVIRIGRWAFSFCYGLESVVISDTVTSIGNGAFYECIALTSVKIGNSVETIGDEAFAYGPVLTNFEIPASVTRIDTVSSITCDAFVVDADNMTYSSDAFGCLYNKDKTVLIRYPVANKRESFAIPTGVTGIGEESFYRYVGTSLQSVTIPNSVTYIGNSAFSGCSSLTSITIPNSVTSIGSSVFSGCSSLTSVTIGNSVTSIGNYAFSGCRSLTSVTIGNSVTSIGNYAFSGCRSLTSVAIPDSVTSIDYWAFSNCTSLKDVYYGGNAEQWDSISIAHGNDSLLNATINYYYDFAADGKVKIEFRYADTGELIDTSAEYPVDARDSLNFKDQYGRHRHESGANGILYLGDYYFPLTYVNAWWQSSFGGPAYKYEAERTIEASAGDVVCFYLSENGEGSVSVQPAATYTPTSDAEVADRNDAFVKAHLTAYSQSVLPMMFNKSFSNLAEISDTKLTLAKIKKYADAAVDFVTLDLGDAIGKVTANYYEMYLSSLILDFTKNKFGNEWDRKVDKIFGSYKTVYGFFKDAFQSTAEWEEYVTKDVEFDFLKFFKFDDYCDDIPDATFNAFKKLLSGNNTKLKTFFNELLGSLQIGADAINQMCEKVTTAMDVAKAFREVYNAYVVATAFHEVTDDFYKVMLDAADELDNVEEAAPDAGRQLRIAIQEAKLNSNTVGDVICTILKEFEGQAAKIAWDKLGKPLLMPIMCTKVASLLKIKASTVAVYTALIGGGNKVINLFTGADDYSEKYQLIAKITPVEHALRLAVKNQFQRLIDDYPQLNSDLNMENTTRFETSVQLLKHTNAYLFQLDYDICAISKRRILSDGAALQKEMNKASKYKASWNNLSCHDETEFSDYKLVTVKCPVDVYVYMPNDFLVTSIINEQIEESDPEFTVLVAAGEKTIVYPAEYDCIAKIVARESGTMDYGVMELDDLETIREVETFDIPLTEGQVFTDVIPKETGVEKENYALTTNSETISVDYDSMDNCTGQHTFGDWHESEFSRTRVCTACGYTESEVLHISHDDPEIAYSVKPTCTKGGHTIMICPGCGEQLADGIDCPPLGHELNEDTRVTVDATCGKAGSVSCTCWDCGETITETIPATGEHAHGNVVRENEIAATCQATGSHDEVVYCTKCGDELSRETVIDQKLAHTPGNVVIENEKSATCTSKGSYDEVVYCTGCGKVQSRKTIVTNALGHAYVNHAAKEPTCEEPGWDAYQICSRCSYTTFAEKEVLGHIDEDEDGYCDREDCGEPMEGADLCPYCGKLHKGFFQKFIGFFHKLIYRLTHLFG